jgi:hypothetical protein
MVDPEGIPVQCTTCQFVFTAGATIAAPASSRVATDLGGRPSAGDGQGAVAPPSPAAEAAPAPGGANKTLIFGGHQVQRPSPAPELRSPEGKTQIFGRAAPAELIGARPTLPPGGSVPGSANKTQIFGLAGPAAGAPGAGVQPPGGANKTQVFGVGEAGSPASGAPREGLPGGGNKTQIFGRVGPAPAPGAAAPVVAPGGSLPGGAHKTQIFGIAQVAPAPAAVAPSPEPPGPPNLAPRARAEQLAVPTTRPIPAEAAPPRPADPPPPPRRASTQIFGAVEAAGLGPGGAARRDTPEPGSSATQPTTPMHGVVLTSELPTPALGLPAVRPLPSELLAPDRIPHPRPRAVTAPGIAPLPRGKRPSQELSPVVIHSRPRRRATVERQLQAADDFEASLRQGPRAARWVILALVAIVLGLAAAWLLRAGGEQALAPAADVQPRPIAPPAPRPSP